MQELKSLGKQINQDKQSAPFATMSVDVNDARSGDSYCLKQKAAKLLNLSCVVSEGHTHTTSIVEHVLPPCDKNVVQAHGPGRQEIPATSTCLSRPWNGLSKVKLIKTVIEPYEWTNTRLSSLKSALDLRSFPQPCLVGSARLC